MYHYKACGLDNVWLENGYTVKKTPYGDAVAVRDAEQLHSVLGVELTKKNGRLTPNEVRFLRTQLCLSQKSLGEMLGVSDQAVSLWERGQGDIPVSQDTLIRMIYLHKVNGDGDVCQIINRVNTVDRLLHQKIVAREKQSHWATDSLYEKEVPVNA